MRCIAFLWFCITDTPHPLLQTIPGPCGITIDPCKSRIAIPKSSMPVDDAGNGSSSSSSRKNRRALLDMYAAKPCKVQNHRAGTLPRVEIDKGQIIVLERCPEWRLAKVRATLVRLQKQKGVGTVNISRVPKSPDLAYSSRSGDPYNSRKTLNTQWETVPLYASAIGMP